MAPIHRHVMLETIPADVLEQLLKARNSDDTVTTEALDFIRRNLAFTDVRSHPAM